MKADETGSTGAKLSIDSVHTDLKIGFDSPRSPIIPSSSSGSSAPSSQVPTQPTAAPRHSLSSLEISDGNVDDEDYDHMNVADSPEGPLLPGLGANMALEELAIGSGKSNLKMAFMNMANSIIGAGIIGQPYAVRQSGLVGGLVLLVGLTIVIDWTIRLMVVNAKMSGTDTFQATVAHCFGKIGLITISLAQGLFAFGGSMAFCVIIGDTIPHVILALFPSWETLPVLSFLVRRNSIIVICTTFISYPLALNRDISKLAKASALALVSMLIIVLTVVIRGPQLSSEMKGSFSLPLLTINSGLLQGVSVISFAFVCHHNSLLIYDSLKKPTMDRFAIVTHWSTGVSMVACIAMGVGGFLVFKDRTKGNVLNNFPPDDTMANIARFCFGLNMLTTLPLEIFVCREVILNYFYPSNSLPEGAGGESFNYRRHVITTTVLVFTAMSISLFTCNLGVILEIVGATSACVMAYVLPPMCFIKLTGNRSLRNLLPSYICVSFGILVMVISTVQSIVKIVAGGDGSEDHCVQ
ncbi:uncharacterized protein SAPINGB_P001404 [Magnusiomyces paraingens]|uniref:Amino acid transporter transmembrane domain-containing protein n=1 Tax=Magnusiomyces paraingens TaxID=2606893 RepID=A0A5E8B5J2_9ASCO|nr:uncharacterized protein SAPINGB_P001404 [Saprochaete ingens]VVT46823.1 unnamed protein product [Saprochaete ingens]